MNFLYTGERAMHLIKRLTPPLLMDIYKRNSHKSQYIEVEKTDSIDFEQLHYLRTPVVFNIPIDKVRYSGGQALNYHQHHFMQYYKCGVKALKDYYDKHNPKTIYENNFIFDQKGKQIDLPWVKESQKKTNKGEYGLGVEHGYADYGPVSSAKIELEAKRLDYCLNSIKKHGYITNNIAGTDGGFPRGVFLVSSSGNWSFCIIGSKHRVSALAYLGWKNIPVCCQPNFPRCIFESDISNWPRVKSGEFKVDEAKLIFNSYFRDSDLKLW